MTFCQTSSAELTNSDQTQVDETQITQPSTGGYSKATCDSIEAKFQNHIMGILDSAISASSKSYNCLKSNRKNNTPNCKKLNSMNLGNLKKYRRSLKKLYQEMANHWVREKSKQDARFKACLGLPVQFQRNIRRLRTKLPYYRCQPIITRWSHGLDQLTKEYLDGKQTITTLKPEEIAHLKAFHHSPLKRIISTNALFDSRLNNSELKQKLASAYNTIRIGVEKLKKKVSKLKDRQKYILFDFQNQFTAFTNTLPPQTRPKATRCIKSSGFFRDCTINVSKQGSRCGSRIWRLGKEMLPVVPLIDSIKGMGNVMAAEASGVMTSSEATQKRAELATLGILGLGGITGGVSLLAKPLMRSAVRTSGVRTSAVETGNSRTTRSNDRSVVLLSQSVERRSAELKRQNDLDLKQLLDLKEELVSDQNKVTTQLKEMGLDYSPVPDLEPMYAAQYSDLRKRSLRNSQIDPSDVPTQVQSVLRIRKGATKGRRHNNPRDLALKHKDIDAKIKEVEEMGVKVVIDPSLERTWVLGYYSPEQKVLSIRANSDWTVFEHEFQHALFHKYLEDGPSFGGSSIGLVNRISKSGQSLRQMREQLPPQIRKHWSRREQNVILRYLRDDMPILALNERLSVNRQLELLGWKRYKPKHRFYEIDTWMSDYATKHLDEGLNRQTYYRSSDLSTQEYLMLQNISIIKHATLFGLEDAARTYGQDILVNALRTYSKYNDDPLLKALSRDAANIDIIHDAVYREFEAALKKRIGQIKKESREATNTATKKVNPTAETYDNIEINTIIVNGIADRVVDASVGASAAIAAAVGADLTLKEDPFFLNLPRNIRSAIQSAKEVFYSERGILVKDQNGQAQFFPSEKKK